MADSPGPAPLRPLFASPAPIPLASPSPAPGPVAFLLPSQQRPQRLARLPRAWMAGGAVPMLGAPALAAPPPPAAAGAPLLVWLTPLLLGGVLLAGYRLCFPNCRPDHILVIAGRRQRRRDGQETGYRVITGGRALALPLLERRSWMDVRTRPVAIHVEQAYAEGGTPIDVEAVATVKIATDGATVGNAIERFLHHDPQELVEVSRQTLEGHLRAMVAALTPEQVNEDRLRFAHQVAESVQPAMAKLGLQLDTFKILRVSDRVEYYDALGRSRLAEVLRDAAIAEAEGLGDADQREAQAQQRAEVASTQARTIVQQKHNALRAIRAQLDQQARQAEERVEAAAAEARARAEQALQTLRAELERRRLEADIVLPAKAQQEAQERRAEGAAAATAESLKAAAAVNDRLAAVWHSAGEDAATIFLLQQVEGILAEASGLAEQLQLGRIAVLESGSPASLAELVSLYPAVMRSFLDSARDLLGIDVLASFGAKPSGSVPPTPLLP